VFGLSVTELSAKTSVRQPERKGSSCSLKTGAQRARIIRIDQIKYIGKESNMLEEVEAGLVHSLQNVYTEYPDPKRDEWKTKILPALKNAPRHLLVKNTPLSRTEITDIRAGRVRPHPKNQKLIVDVLRKLGLL